nr:B9 domain-containing protein 1 isoform X1 [Manis javanica]
MPSVSRTTPVPLSNRACCLGPFLAPPALPWRPRVPVSSCLWSTGRWRAPSFLSTMTSTASTALCMARTGLPQRVWRRAFPRSHPRAKMCGKRWCGTSPSTSPSKAPTRMAGHRLCSACTDRTCLGMMWYEATGQCMCLSHPAGTKRPSPCLSQNPRLNCRSLQGRRILLGAAQRGLPPTRLHLHSPEDRPENLPGGKLLESQHSGLTAGEEAAAQPLGGTQSLPSLPLSLDTTLSRFKGSHEVLPA